MVWLSKNLVVLRTTLQIISISLYKIVGFHFTDSKNHGKDLAIHFSWLVT
jgi:NADH:ubiquinone oxidoreductase subunit 5 (subunit L)/multisubunit Na+/H+ antiporter MnhA subunit